MMMNNQQHHHHQQQQQQQQQPQQQQTPTPNKLKKGYKLSHQKLVLDIDIDKAVIEGYTELYIQPQTRKLRQEKIRLNTRQLVVSRVEVNNIEAQFTVKNYLECIVGSSDARDLDTYQAYHRAATFSSEDGELLIDIPASLQFYEIITETINPVTDDNNNNNNSSQSQQQNGTKLNESSKDLSLSTASGTTAQTRQHIQFTPLFVKVFYKLSSPSGGVMFVRPDANEWPTRRSHCYTVSQADGARMWFPCCDQLSEKCTWELDLTARADLVVVSIGQLLEKVASEDETRNTFIYRQEVPTCAAGIGMAVGPFEIYPDPFLHSVNHFCLPHRLADLKHSVHFFTTAFKFFEEYLGSSFPYSSYKQVFVDDVPDNQNSYATLAILSTHLLHSARAIDQTFETRSTLSQMLASQWFLWYIGPKTWSDLWLSQALSGHLLSIFLRKMFGINHYRLQLSKDIEFVCQLDNGTQPPLSYELFNHPIELFSEFQRKKAPLIIYMIERLISEDGLRKVLNSMLVSQTGNEPIETIMPTKKFLKMIKTLTGQDLKQFSEKWIYGKGTPHLVCGFYFNRKRHQTEFAMKQLSARPEDKLTAPITLRITELDRTYEHILNFDEDWNEYDFPCHSRNRKSKKKKIRHDDGEEMEIDLSQKRETPLLWFRIDPEIEWIHKITFRQPEYMWVHQLELDRDVIAQSEALKGLSNFSTMYSLRSVFKFFSNQKQYYKVRMEAALVISKLTCKETNYEGLDLMINYFKQHYYDQESGLMDDNNFTDFISYFIKKIIPVSISLMKDKDGRTPAEAIEFLIDILKDNENSSNPYFDNYYLASIISSLANVHTNIDHLVKSLHNQIIRYLKYDQLYPCYKNTITIAALNALCHFQAMRYIPVDLQIFLDHTQYRYFEDIRKTAFTCYYKLAYIFPQHTNYPPTYSSSNKNNNHSIIPSSSSSSTKTSHLHFILDCFNIEKSPTIKHFLINLISSPPPSMEERAYISLFKDDYHLIDRLWNILNSNVTAYDFLLRQNIQKLYKSFYGNNTPMIIVHRRKKAPSNIKLKAVVGSNQKPPSSHSRHGDRRQDRMITSSSGSSSSSSSSSLLKKRKQPEEFEQPLKIHIKVEPNGGVPSPSTMNSNQPNINNNNNNINNSINNNNNGSQSPLSKVGDEIISGSSGSGHREHHHHHRSSDHHHRDRNNSEHHHHRESRGGESKEEELLKKYLDDEDFEDDKELKEFWELREKKHHRKHRDRRDHHREHRDHTSEALENLDKDIARDLNKELSREHRSKEKDYIGSLINLDLEADEDFKKDLHLIEDIENRELRRNKKHKHSEHHRGSGEHREHRSGEKHRSGEHRNSTHNSDTSFEEDIMKHETDKDESFDKNLFSGATSNKDRKERDQPPQPQQPPQSQPPHPTRSGSSEHRSSIGSGEHREHREHRSERSSGEHRERGDRENRSSSGNELRESREPREHREHRERRDSSGSSGEHRERSERPDRGDREAREPREHRTERSERRDSSGSSGEHRERSERPERGDREHKDKSSTATGSTEQQQQTNIVSSNRGEREKGGEHRERERPERTDTREHREPRPDRSERATERSEHRSSERSERSEHRSSERSERDRSATSDSHVGSNRPDRSERSERGSERSERGERGERDRGELSSANREHRETSRSERSERSERGERSERDRGERERGERERSERPERGERERGERNERERGERGEHRSERSERDREHSRPDRETLRAEREREREQQREREREREREKHQVIEHTHDPTPSKSETPKLRIPIRLSKNVGGGAATNSSSSGIHKEADQHPPPAAAQHSTENIDINITSPPPPVQELKKRIVFKTNNNNNNTSTTTTTTTTQQKTESVTTPTTTSTSTPTTPPNSSEGAGGAPKPKLLLKINLGANKIQKEI